MSNLDCEDRIDALVQKLSAMLAMTCGEPGGTFRRMSDDIQENYMWACVDMASDLRDLVLGTSQANVMTEEAGHA